MLTTIDEFSRKCHSISEYIRSDNGSEFIATELRAWLSGIGVKTAYITPPATLGRMNFVRALMAPSETIFWMGRSSIAYKKPR
jgi:hypothetical protein